MGRYSNYPCWPEQPTIFNKNVPAQWTKEQIRDVFKSFDRNGDGKLSKEELKAAFKKLGSRWSSFRAKTALRHVDANGDGFISIDEELKDLIDYAFERDYKL